MNPWNATSMLAFLQWRDGARLARDVRNQLLSRAAMSVRAPELYATLDGRAALLGRLRALPPESLQSLLGAPELVYRLVGAARGEQGFEDWFERCIAVEEARAEGGSPRSWSACGDLGPDGAGGAAQALRLDGVPIDHLSAWLDNPMDGGDFRNVRFGPTVRYSRAEASEILGKLIEARRLILDACPAAWGMVLQSARVIQLRRDPTNPSFATSASCNTEIGRVVLLNAHLDSFDAPTIANALLHESIHGVVYGLEQIAPLLPTTDPHNSDDLLVVSPWTGSRLHLHTYVHACFVWFGLASFWRALDRRLEPREARHLRRALSGFLDGAALRPLRAHAALLAEGVLETVEVLSGILQVDERRLFHWEPTPVAGGRHGLGLAGREEASGAPVFGKLSVRARSDRALEREGRLLTRLEGASGVPRIVAAERLEGRPLLVLERLELRELPGTGPRLWQASIGLARSLEQVHARRVIHRDVRPDHLLWRGETLVLVDFSCALDLDAAEGAGGTVGVWQCSPPDQLLPDRPIPGAHWDTYAACASIFWLLTGRAPRCQEDPSGRLNARGEALWAVARAAVVQTPHRDEPALRSAFARARSGLDYASILADHPVAALTSEDEQALLDGVRALEGSEASGRALVAVLSRGLDARVERRFTDGGALANALTRALAGEGDPLLV